MGTGISTFGSAILAVLDAPVLLQRVDHLRTAPLVAVNDPWGFGARSSGRPPARRRGTTSTASRGSARSAGVRPPPPGDGPRRGARTPSGPTASRSSRRRPGRPRGQLLRRREEELTHAGHGAHRHPRGGLRLHHGDDLRVLDVLDHLGIEWVGVIGLILGGLLGFMIAWYLWMTRRRLERDPSDDPLGDIDEIQGEYGFFSPHSWWPLFLGASAAVCFAGLAVGWWLFIIGAFFAIPALVGWTFEYWKGQTALVAAHDHQRATRETGWPAVVWDARVRSSPRRARAACVPRCRSGGRSRAPRSPRSPRAAPRRPRTSSVSGPRKRVIRSGQRARSHQPPRSVSGVPS